MCRLKRWLSGLNVFCVSMRTRGHIPSTHINVRHEEWPTCNLSTPETETRILRVSWLLKLANLASSELKWERTWWWQYIVSVCGHGMHAHAHEYEYLPTNTHAPTYIHVYEHRVHMQWQEDKMKFMPYLKNVVCQKTSKNLIIKECFIRKHKARS